MVGMEMVLLVSINGSIYDTLVWQAGSAESFSIPVDIGDVLDFDYVLAIFGGTKLIQVKIHMRFTMPVEFLVLVFSILAQGKQMMFLVFACPSCTTPSDL